MPLTTGAGRGRLAPLAVLLGALAACDRRSPGQSRPTSAPGAPAEPGASAPTAASAPAPASARAPASGAAADGEAGPPSFEVEFEGKLRGGPAAERHVVLVTSGPCTVETAATAATIAIGEGRTRAGVRQFWTEGNVREGTLAHVCALALDRDGRLIGFGAHARNPLRLSAGGKAELEVEGLDITLSPVSPPRPLPPDRY